MPLSTTTTTTTTPMFTHRNTSVCHLSLPALFLPLHLPDLFVTPPSPPPCFPYLCSTQPLHSAASAIVAKLHRLLKIEHAATLRAIFPALYLYLPLSLSGESARSRVGGVRCLWHISQCRKSCDLRQGQPLFHGNRSLIVLKSQAGV